jgi:dephospho-CoA kinase
MHSPIQHHRMVLIGVTGGIGSGKSVVCDMFASLGAPVFSADACAKDIADTDSTAREKITALLGDGVYTDAGKLNRALTATKVFGDPELLGQLNEILHPLVFEEIDRWRERLSAPYALVEAALIFESGLDEVLDYNLVVIAADDLRVERVMKRDGCSRDDVLRRMMHQLSNEELRRHADFILVNEGDAADIQGTVRFYHTLFSSLHQRKELNDND